MRLSHPNNDRLRKLIGSNFALLACVLFALPSRAQTAETRVDCESISSPILGRSVDYCIALPPGYDAGADRYPVLYYLHGLFEHARSWSEHTGQQTWETLMSQGKIGKYIVVMPEG